MTEERRDIDVPTLLTVRGAAEELSEELMERTASPSYVYGIPWGFPKLDMKTGGIQQEETTVLIARPGVGKSAFAGQVALNVGRWFKSTGSDKVVRIISLEMGWKRWVQRIACQVADVPIHKIVSGYASVAEGDKYNVALNDMSKLPIEGVDVGADVHEINRFIRHNSKTHEDGKRSNCGLWILDHLGIIQGGEGKDAFSSLNHSSTVLRQLSKEVAPGLLLSQMNRQAEMRDDKRPRTSDIYGSDRVLQDARRVIGLYREDVYMKLGEAERKEPQPAEVIILKANNGELGVLDYTFIPARLEWVENG